MSELVTIDGSLAHYSDGGSLALAFDEMTLGEEAVSALEGSIAVPDGPSVPDWEVLGRSSLGIVAGIDIRRADLPLTHENGAVLLPIELTAHAELGHSLIQRLYDLMVDHKPGESLRWERHHLPFGRLIQRGGLVQLTNEELDEALSEYLFASGEFSDRRGDVVI